VFFVLSKLLDIVIDPICFCGVPALLGGLLLARGSESRLAASRSGAEAAASQGKRRTLGMALVFGGLSALFICALPAFSNRLWHWLESGATKTQQPGVVYDAVVLLGGTVSPGGSLRDEPAWNDNVERLLEVRELLLKGEAKVAIVSGGQLKNGLRTEAEYLQEELVRLGVPKEQVVLEAKANNTRENATESKKLLDEMGAKRVLLVTSAHHLPRAVGCFRAAGVEPDVLPVDFRLRDPGDDPHWFPRAEYLSQTSRALRELLGRLVYRVLGYTK
jgi:uncharacterized SAM-binding protein YcdF (DUF218 family)